MKTPTSVLTSTFFCFVIFASIVHSAFPEEYSNQEDNAAVSWGRYGADWVLFPDDLGNLHFVNMTFQRSTDALPTRQVHFQLYTRENPDQYEELFIQEDDDDENDSDADNKSQNRSKYFSGENPLKMLSHGWMSSGQSSTVINMKDAYLKTGPMNIVIIDWHEMADEPTYIIAAKLTSHVGKQVGRMAKTLMKQYSMSGRDVHLVGHSLGAHIVGYGGRWLTGQNMTVSRVTGLDPARPLFEVPQSSGIKPDDADFVDVIHSNGGVLGEKGSHGVADFFPNGGGPQQPGCDGLLQLVDACSHGRSHEYFTESILTGGFVSRQCDSWSLYTAGDCKSNAAMSMGEPCKDTARGNYYLYTNSDSPYSKDENYD